MKRIIIKLFKFDLMQHRWGRAYIGGEFFHISCIQLGMAPFWSDEPITSCQSKTIGWEKHPMPKKLKDIELSIWKAEIKEKEFKTKP